MSVRSYLLDAFYSLGSRINKRTGGVNDENVEGVLGPRLPELELTLDDQELVDLSDTWEKVWNDSEVKTKWTQSGDENEKYWKGDHYDKPELDTRRSVKDNAIFEGLETYLPQVTRRNPEPMVSLAQSEQQSDAGIQYAHAVQLELGELADEINLRLKLKGAARNHEIRLLGALKVGWDLDEDRPSVEVVRPTKLLLDPEAITDEMGYRGERIGEYKKEPAWRLVALMEKTKGSAENISYVKDLVKQDMGTELGFIEWWTPDYVFWKLNSRVLMKRKNPHWNYDEEPAPAPQAPQGEQQPIQAEQPAAEAPEAPAAAPQGLPAIPQLDQGNAEAPEQQAQPEPRKGVNHFKVRKMPYILLAIYTLGKQPVNVTSNIGQNLANQDLINKRIRQIDRNADNANNGMVVSLARSGLTKDEAKNVTIALRNGGVVAIPDGAPQEAIYKPANSELPVYVYNQLVDTRNRVRDIWGTRGSSPAGLQSEDTVRGKIIVQGLDTDRIGGGISEYLEQMADSAYNWLVQLLYVYDDRFVEQITNGVPLPKIKVTVKEGSLLPKDSSTIANQAMSLAEGGKMSLIDLYKRLDYPNPEELAANVWLEANAPEVLFENDPRVQKVLQQRAAAAKGQEKPPAESINFKDLPPEGKAQMAAKVGIQLHPEGIAAHEQNNNAPPATPQLPIAAQGP